MSKHRIIRKVSLFQCFQPWNNSNDNQLLTDEKEKDNNSKDNDKVPSIHSSNGSVNSPVQSVTQVYSSKCNQCNNISDGYDDTRNGVFYCNECWQMYDNNVV